MESEKTSYIRDVWHDNLETEMANIREMIVSYPVISMVRRVQPPPPPLWHVHAASPPMCAALQDTEFPGVVAKPIGSFKSSSDFHYQTLRCNVDLLKIIQLGLTFSTDEGELAPGVCTYQFNFKFSLAEDIYAQDSIGARTRPGLPPPAAPSPATPSADDDALLLVGRRSADSLGHRLPPSRGREPGAACHPHCTRSLPPTDPPTLHALLTAHRRLRPDGGHVCCASVRPVARALICAAARPLVSQYGSDVTYFAELLISYPHVHTYMCIHTHMCIHTYMCSMASTSPTLPSCSSLRAVC